MAILCRQPAEFAEFVIRYQAQGRAERILGHLHKSLFFEQQVIACMGGENLIQQCVQINLLGASLILERVVYVIPESEVHRNCLSFQPLRVKGNSNLPRRAVEDPLFTAFAQMATLLHNRLLLFLRLISEPRR